MLYKILFGLGGFMLRQISLSPTWAFRNMWMKLLWSVGLPRILPYWAWRFGGGPAFTWSFRLALATILLIPFLILNGLGIQISWSYSLFFIGGFLIADAIWQWLRYRAIDGFIGGVTKKNPKLFDDFITSRQQGPKEKSDSSLRR